MRTFYNIVVGVLGVFCFASASFSQAPGNTCASAVALTSPAVGGSITTGAQTTCGRVNDFAAGFSSVSTFYGGGEDGVYSMVVPAGGGNYTFSFPNSGATWKILSIHSACPPTTANTLGGFTTGSGRSGTWTGNLPAGTVFIVIDTWPSPNCGAFTLNITRNAVYNPCATIPTLTCGAAATSYSMAASAGAWSSYGGPFGVPGQEKLFAFTPTTTGVHNVTVNASAGYVDLFWKAQSSGCNSTGWTYVNDILGTETWGITLTAGVTYYIMLDDENTTANTGTISITCPTVAGPANDDCVNATPLPCGTSNLAGTTVNSVSETAPGGGGLASNFGVWYSFTGNGQQTTISSTGTGGFDHEMTVLSGSCGALTLLTSLDGFGANGTETYTFNTVNGTIYYVYVAHWLSSGTSADVGTFTISRSCVTLPPPPANDNCANAQLVTIQCPASATAVSGTTIGATEDVIAKPTCDNIGTINDVWYTFNSGPNTSVDLTLTLGTASWIGAEVHTTCGNPAPGLTIGGNAGNCDFNLSAPNPTVITGLTPNTTYRLRLFTNVTYDIAGTFSFTLTNSANNPGAVSVPASICAGTATSITNVTAATGGPNNVNYYFYYRGGPSNVGWQMYDGPTTNTSSSLPAAVINTPGTWFIARNSDFGCGQANNATTLDLQLIVNAASTAPALSGTSPVCPSTSVTINATGGVASPGSTINWYTGPNGTGSFLGTSSSYTATPASTTTYYARREGGCNTTSDGTYTITVNNPTLTTAPTNGDMVWRGASNTDWALLGNWWQYNGSAYTAANAAPTSAQNVIIPANQTCVINQPNTFANAGSAKTLRIESGANLTMGNGTLTVAENWVNNGTFAPGTGTIAFTGTGNHSISGSSATHAFNNLTMNKNGEIILSVPIIIAGSLTLTDGRLNIVNFNLDLPTNTINGGNASSFVKTSGSGTLNRNVAGIPVSFPVGRSAYNAATLTNSGTADKYSIRVIDNVTDIGTNADAGPTTSMAVVNRTWMINEQVAGGSNVTLGLNWNGAPEHLNGFQPTNAFIAHYMSGAGLWDNIGGAVATNTIETTGITSFSPFTISSDLNFAPLPVELMSFSSSCLDNDVAIKWTTASENNSMHFIVETSKDAMNWEVLSVVPAAQFSTSILNYAITHEGAAREKNYYRLKQVDLDGAVEFFNVIYANCGNVAGNPVVFPNPSNGDFTIDFSGAEMKGVVQLSIMNAEGKEISTREVNLEEGVSTYQFNNMEPQPGIYYLKIVDTTGRSFIIKHSFI
jgi:hypothetical protein